jgi:peptide-methionine (R)-S-oxide reductase
MDEKKKMELSEEEWKVRLTPTQYHVLREGGTERPGTGKYYHNKEEGVYRCAGCGTPLFRSDAKYESGSGWPSFYDALDKDKIEERTDRSFGMARTEIRCKKCGGHLGHVFDDGPDPTGLRYCVNSESLQFEKK